MYSLRAIATVVILAAFGATPLHAGPSSAASEWPLLGGDYEQSQHSRLSQINDKNVQRLGLAWVADMPSGDSLVGQPLIKDGVIYQSGPMGPIFANDVRTGKSLWTFVPEIRISPKQSYTGFWTLHFTRGLALDGENIYRAFNCQILAVSRKTGRQVWAADSCDPTQEIGISGAPRVGGGKVFIGNTTGDRGTDRAYVDAFDATTGRHLWRFYTSPGDPSKPFESPQLEMAAKTWGTDYWKYGHGGCSAWEAITYDPSSDTLYFGTNGPAPLSPSLRAPDAGDELFANSIIAVNATTGKYLWHYQTVQHDAWDFDATFHIMLADLPQADGRKRRVVMTAPKNGFFYVLDAKTGKFISANNIVPVNWASRIDPVTGRPVLTEEAKYWEHPDKKTLILPGDGGHNWELMAYQPSLGLVYIPASIIPTTMWINPKEPLGGVSLDDFAGFTPDAQVKSKGELIAWDPVTQTKRWSVDRPVPFDGGILATDGNLVFQGTGEGKFQALNAMSGQVLWTYDTHGSILAAPVTVEIDGAQMIIVPSGNGGGSGSRGMARFINTERSQGPSRLLAFRLGGKAALPPVVVEPFPPPALPKQPVELAENGKRVYANSACGYCHGLEVVGSGPGIPDLRKLSKEKFELLKGIVVEGLLRPAGMPSFPELTDADVNALKAYITNQAWERYESTREPKR
jgi:quinohemoprotein ethanol dehydrogenase